MFDVKLLYDNEGLTDDLFRVFLVYVASSNRPPHELLDPRDKDLEQSYRQEFAGMPRDPVALDDLRDTRSRLIEDIRSRLDANAALNLGRSAGVTFHKPPQPDGHRVGTERAQHPMGEPRTDATCGEGVEKTRKIMVATGGLEPPTPAL